MTTVTLDRAAINSLVRWMENSERIELQVSEDAIEFVAVPFDLAIRIPLRDE